MPATVRWRLAAAIRERPFQFASSHVAPGIRQSLKFAQVAAFHHSSSQPLASPFASLVQKLGQVLKVTVSVDKLSQAIQSGPVGAPPRMLEASRGPARCWS